MLGILTEVPSAYLMFASKPQPPLAHFAGVVIRFFFFLPLPDDFANAQNPDDACPKGSAIGSGKVAARTPFNGVADFTGTVNAYNAPKGLILYVNVQSANQTLVQQLWTSPATP